MHGPPSTKPVFGRRASWGVQTPGLSVASPQWLRAQQSCVKRSIALGVAPRPPYHAAPAAKAVGRTMIATLPPLPPKSSAPPQTIPVLSLREFSHGTPAQRAAFVQGLGDALVDI